MHIPKFYLPKLYLFILQCLSIIISSSSFATDLSFLYSTSSLSQKSYLDATWTQQGNPKKDNLMSITLGYATGTSNGYDTLNNIIPISSNEFSASAGLATPKYWTWSFGLTQQNDNPDNVQVLASYFQITKKIRFTNKKDLLTGFVPNVKFKFRVFNSQYTHQPMGTAGALNFNQNAFKASFLYATNSLYDFSLGYKKYFYNDDPAAYVTKTTALNLGNMTTLFTNTISQMPDNILSIAFNLHISTKTSLEFSTSQTKDAADSGSGTETTVGIAYEINNNWGINCSASQSKFTNISTSTTYTSFGLDYFF